MIKTRIIELFGLFRGRADYKGAGCDASAPNKSGHTKHIKCTEFTPEGVKKRAFHCASPPKAPGTGIKQQPCPDLKTQ